MTTIEYIDWLIKNPQEYAGAMESCKKLMQETMNQTIKENKNGK